ncbi:MAG: SUMF1/EgtB/PvdO family nonheme iron enzyme [Planctomycetaceae bacterium]
MVTFPSRPLGLAVALLVAVSLTAQSVNATLVLDWVTVGDPANNMDAAQGGNAPYGAVTNTFQIMKFEFTNSQYAQFLNSIDPSGTNPYSVYSTAMATDARGGIAKTGTATGSLYTVKANMGDKPVNNVSWFDAARVANWLTNGATGTSSTETGAYTLNGASTGNAPSRTPGSTYYIPTENEWYKAAFYKGGSANAGYWYYAPQSTSGNNPLTVTANSTGIGSAGSTGNSANYNNIAAWNGQSGNVTTVGTNGGPSAYGSFDMSGNVWEWNDLAGQGGIFGGNKGLRGGAWDSTLSRDLSSSYRAEVSPTFQYNGLGFRLAAVPEPSTCLMAAGGLACMAWMTTRRHSRCKVA